MGIEQVSFSVKQAAELSGNSRSFILKLINDKYFNEKDGTLRVFRNGTRSHYLITRKGLSKLTGHEFKDQDLFAMANVLLSEAVRQGVFEKSMGRQI